MGGKGKGGKAQGFRIEISTKRHARGGGNFEKKKKIYYIIIFLISRPPDWLFSTFLSGEKTLVEVTVFSAWIGIFFGKIRRIKPRGQVG